MANDQQTSTNYGPFTDALTGPLTPQNQQIAQQPVGYGGTSATLAQFANSFINGARAGQRTKYERSEQQKQQQEKNLDLLNAQVQSDPRVNTDGKKFAMQQYLHAKYYTVNEHLQGARDQKENPLIGLAKSITGAVLGPHKIKNIRTLGQT